MTDQNLTPLQLVAKVKALEDTTEVLERIVLAMAATHITLMSRREAFVAGVGGHLLESLQTATEEHRDHIWPQINRRLIQIDDALEAFNRNGG